MEIEVVYYERLEGVLQKVTELVLSANDAPLSQVLREELPEVKCALHWCISVVFNTELQHDRTWGSREGSACLQILLAAV